MTIFEVLNFNRELLDRLRSMGVSLDDTRYIDLFADFSKMIADGNKVSYAVAVLADRYNVSERKVYSLIKRYKSDCNSLIFGGGGISIRRINRALTSFKCGARALQWVPR